MKKTVLFLLFVLMPALVWAQGYDKSRGGTQAKEGKSAIELQPQRISIGFGSFFDQENVTFSKEALYVSVQWHGIELPFLEDGTSTGLSFEGHPAKLIEKVIEGERFLAIEDVDYRIWSTTRVPVSAIPIKALQDGTPGRMFTGVDVLLVEGGPLDWTEDFDARLVIGGDLGVLGPGNLVFELYMLQEDVPIAFSIFYGF